MLARPLPPSFIETYSLSTSSLGCNTLCIVISFLVLWSICLSSSLVHLRKGPEYLTSGTAQVFIPLIRFLLLSFVSSSFLVLLRFFLNFFFHFHLFEGVILQDAQVISASVFILSWFGSSILSVSCRLPLFITSIAHFSMPNSIPMSRLYILTVCIRVSSSFSFFANSFVVFWPLARANMPFQSDAPEGNDTFQWRVMERDRVGGLRLIIWDKVKVTLCHYGVMHWKRVTSELHDSDFRLMTIKHAIPKIE